MAKVAPVLPQLEILMYMHEKRINAWFDAAWNNQKPLLYSSVDLRHAGFKVAPVDTNLFPAGFNNLSPAAYLRTAERWQHFFQREFPNAKKVLLIPENHTRNMGYLDNLSTIIELLLKSGLDVKLGSLLATKETPYRVTTQKGEQLHGHVLVNKDGVIQTDGGFVPDVVVLNNDLSAGVPEVLQNVKQPMVPAIEHGWHLRRKRTHFAAYQEVAKEFATAFEFDPWLISAHFQYCGALDFKSSAGMECVALNVEKVIRKTRENYVEYGIDAEPYAFIKADAGTYGMGIMTVKSGDEVLSLNKKNRNKMNVIKEGVHVSEVLVQEGVPTMDKVKNAPAEPVIYLADGHAIGGAYRVNAERDATNNLNAAGMSFVGMRDELDDAQAEKAAVSESHQRALGLVGELATLAAAREEAHAEEDAA